MISNKNFLIFNTSMLKHVNNIISKDNENTVCIVWYLIGSRLSDTSDIRKRHEFPPIIENLMKTPENHIINYKNEVIKQFIIQIDPLYTKFSLTFPQEYEKQGMWRKVVDGTNECHFTFNDYRIEYVDYHNIYSQWQMFNTLSNSNIICGMMDFTSRIYDTCNFDYNNFWTCSSNCMADVTAPMYNPVIKIDRQQEINNKLFIRWKYLNEDYEFNQEFLHNTYNPTIASYLIQYEMWRSVELFLSAGLDILRTINMNDKLRWVDEKPIYMLGDKSDSHIHKITEHIKYRNSNKETYYTISHILEKWINTNIQKLEFFVIGEMSKKTELIKRIVYIDEIKFDGRYKDSINSVKYFDYMITNFLKNYSKSFN